MRRACQRNDGGARGGARGSRAAVPPRDVQRHRSLRFVCQHRRGGVRRPTRPPPAAVCNLIATTNDESYHGSASELPPSTSHGYAEWDFSGVPDPVMFRRFLNVADYWFGCSDTSRAGSYDPARKCFMVAIGDVVDGARSAGDGDGEPPRDPGASASRNPGPSAPPPRRREAPTSTHNLLKRASSRRSS
jgi:hypothetical protein